MSINPAEKQKLGLTHDNLHHFLDFLLPKGIADSSLMELRNASLFSLIFFAAARFDNVKAVKIGHFRFKEDHVRVGLQKLKNQKCESGVSVVHVAELETS